MLPDKVEIAIIGAGIAGLAAAFYLSSKYKKRDLLILEAGQPMGFTTAQSGENYRNWWPHPTMAAFTDHSIDLMERIARDTGNTVQMTRRGYALATRSTKLDDLLAQLAAGYGPATPGLIRLHEGGKAGRAAAYAPPGEGRWEDAPGGVDVITDAALIRRNFPQFSEEVAAVLHIRRAGDISAQQLGQFMLERLRAQGGRLVQGRLRAVQPGDGFALEVSTAQGTARLRAETLVNAAGPFLGEVAAMMGVSLPVENLIQQKIAFEDRAGAIPRQAPFAVDLDPQTLDWTATERELLAADPESAWLAEPFPGGVHCRPDGGAGGSWIKLGWAYNQTPSSAAWQPPLDPGFPEIVLRGAAALNPALKAYYGRLPGRIAHYGGYYTMTRENWPLIGPMGPAGAFMVGALSGFGTMAAGAAGELCADWLAGGRLPAYARQLGLERYQDEKLMAELNAQGQRGIL